MRKSVLFALITLGLVGLWQPTAGLAVYNPAYPWDVNGDGIVDIADVARIGQHWLETGPPGWIPEDVNRDGIVDIGDIALVGQHWMETIPSSGPTSTATPTRSATPTGLGTSVAATPSPTPLATASPTEFVQPTLTPTLTPTPFPSRGTLTFGTAHTSSGSPPNVGDTVSIDMLVGLDTNALARGIEFGLSFDSSRLQFRNVTVGSTSFFSAWAASHGASALTFAWSAGSAPGTTTTGGITLLGGPAGVGATGSGTVATVSFVAIAGGHATFAVSNCDVTLLTAPGATSVEKAGLTLGSGSVDISGPPPSQTATPTPTNTPTPTDTLAPTLTPTPPAQTSTATSTAAVGASTTPTATPSVTQLPALTQTPTGTPSPTQTIAATPTPTVSGTPPTATTTPTGVPTPANGNTSMTFSALRVNADGTSSVDVLISTNLILRGAQFGLQFDTPGVVSVTGIDQATFFSDWANANGASSVVVPPWVPISSGASVGSVTLLGGPVPPGGHVSVVGPTGNGTLATITLAPQAPGSATLSLVTPRLTVVSGEQYVSLPPGATNTIQITVHAPTATPSPTPSLTPTVTRTATATSPTGGPVATLTPSATPTSLPIAGTLTFSAPTTTPAVGDVFFVNVVVNLKSGKEVSGIQFALNFDPAIVSLQKVSGGPFLTNWAATHSVAGTGSVSVTPSFSIDTPGHTKIGGISLFGTTPGHGPSGNGTIAIIQFKALKNGATDLTLNSLVVTIPLTSNPTQPDRDTST